MLGGRTGKTLNVNGLLEGIRNVLVIVHNFGMKSTVNSDILSSELYPSVSHLRTRDRRRYDRPNYSASR